MMVVDLLALVPFVLELLFPQSASVRFLRVVYQGEISGSGFRTCQPQKVRLYQAEEL
jgi:hypothetical protein